MKYTVDSHWILETTKLYENSRNKLAIGHVIFVYSVWNLTSNPTYKTSLFQSTQLDRRLALLLVLRVLTAGTVAVNCTNQRMHINPSVSHVSHNDAVHRGWRRWWTNGWMNFLVLLAITQNIFTCAFKHTAIFYLRLCCTKICVRSVEISVECSFYRRLY